MGSLTMKDYVVKHNQVLVQPAYFNGQAAGAEPSDIKQKHGRSGQSHQGVLLEDDVREGRQ